MFTEPKIAPSILSADFMNMARDVAEIEEGGAAFVHVDVMDGHFVPNLTLGVPFVAGLKKITKLPLDVHLMISNPLEQLPWYLEHTPDIVTVHAEALNADAGQFDLAIDMIHDAGCKAAIAMKPDYDVELIKPYIAKLDMVLPMSVFPGFSGQSYIQGTEAKVARIVEMACEAGVSPLIEVDGGLKANDPTRAVCAAGCDVLVRRVRSRGCDCGNEGGRRRGPEKRFRGSVDKRRAGIKGACRQCKPSAYIWTTRQPRHCAMRPQRPWRLIWSRELGRLSAMRTRFTPLAARRSPRSKMRVLAWLAP